jgi:hypothetical protein
MDDLTVKAAIWQGEHRQDRSGMLKVAPGEAGASNAVMVAFVSR